MQSRTLPSALFTACLRPITLAA